MKEIAMKHPRYVLDLANSFRGNAILRNIARFNSRSYSQIGQVLKPGPDGKYSYLSYYLKPFLKWGLIGKDGRVYFITPKGRELIKFIQKFDEKFLTDEPDAVCSNTVKNGQHDMILICRNCSFIQEVKE